MLVCGCYIERNILVFLWMSKADALCLFYLQTSCSGPHGQDVLVPLLTHNKHVVLIRVFICLKFPFDLNKVDAFARATYVHILSFTCICG